MIFIAKVFRKLNLPTMASQLNILSETSKNFSSSTGYSPAELEQFRKVFRTVPSYEESIASKDVIPFLQSINFNKPAETYQRYIEYVDKIFGGRVELTRFIDSMRVQHDPLLLMNEFLKHFDVNNDGYISKEEFEFGMETLRLHAPTVKDVSYEKFLKEADTNKDGRISVSECEVWLKKNIKPV